MSASVDKERAEDAAAARIEAGKARLRLAQAVLTAYTEGLGLAATARRVGCERTTVWRLRVWLGVQSGEGRRDTRSRIEEVRP